jgi:dTDP-4-amino-4,6-dideoxygalactose transaminase
MLEMQAVIGRIQLRKMDAWTAQRQANAEMIADVCRRFPAVRVPRVPAEVRHAHYRLYLFVETHKLAPGWSRDRIIEEILSCGVPCYHGACPEIYLEKAFDGTAYRPAQRLPVAQELGETSLMLLVHPTLTKANMKKACAVLAHVLGMASSGRNEESGVKDAA